MLDVAIQHLIDAKGYVVKTRDSRGYLIGSECEVDGCTRPQLAKGLCTGHYQRLRRFGVRPKKPLAEGETEAQARARRQKHALKYFLGPAGSLRGR